MAEPRLEIEPVQVTKSKFDYELRVWREKPAHKDYNDNNHWTYNIKGADHIPRIGEGICDSYHLVRVFDVVSSVASFGDFVREGQSRTIQPKPVNPVLVFACIDDRIYGAPEKK